MFVTYSTNTTDICYLVGFDVGLRNARGPGQRGQYSDSLRAGLSGDRIPVGARFSAPVQTGPGGHPASYTMGTESLPGVKWRRGVDHPPHLATSVKEE
jgi:hypothetical protein